jgi:hypothetical protein
MAFRSDWKSADQLQADIDAGSIPPTHHLIIDLWRRVEELQAHIEELERQMKKKNSNSDTNALVFHTGLLSSRFIG